MTMTRTARAVLAATFALAAIVGTAADRPSAGLRRLQPEADDYATVDIPNSGLLRDSSTKTKGEDPPAVSLLRQQTHAASNGRLLAKPICGDGQCNGKEDCSTCPADCGTCVPPPTLSPVAPTPPAPAPTPAGSGGVCAGSLAPCTSDADCRVCVSGKDAGNPCSSDADCKNPGTCPAVPAGTCQLVQTAAPTRAPTNGPTNQPVPSPTNQPVPSPTNQPVPSPTNQPVPSPTNQPVPSPTNQPVPSPTNQPVPSPTGQPVSAPTGQPVSAPSLSPTVTRPPLTYVGSNPNITEIGLLKVCEGDCDGYSQCEVGLECFNRNNGEFVAGCSGDMSVNPTWDFCRTPIEGDLAVISDGDRAGAVGRPLGLLGQCRGDCDSYNECEEGLECFFRDSNRYEEVVGCGGDPLMFNGDDFCRIPVPGYVSYMSENGDKIDDGCLGECQGDCDSDEDCQTHLLCFQRDGYTAVPGCAGTGRNNVDYCYDPSKIGPTSSPTLSLVPTISSAPTVSPPTHTPLSTAGGESLELSKSEEGQLVTLSKVVAEVNSPDIVIPLARSYDGHNWESSAGEFAVAAFRSSSIHDCDPVFAQGTCMIPLPAIDVATESYVLSTYGYELPRKAHIARMLERSTFGTTLSDISMFETNYGNNGAVDVNKAFADYVTDQMESIPATSHREYYRKRTNPRWPYSMQPGRSDHPCDAESQWRRYAFTRKDRYDPDSEVAQYLGVSFPDVGESLGSVLYEAEDALVSGPVIESGNSGYTGTGYANFRYGRAGEYIEWTVPASSAGDYQLSFYYANSGGIDRPLEILVNNVSIAELSFPHMGSWTGWVYSDFISVPLASGENKIRAEQLIFEGPNLDHLRIGKDRPSAVLSMHGKARTVVPELWLKGDRTYVFDASYQYELCAYPLTPSVRNSRGIMSVRIEDGTCKDLSVGNPTVTFPPGFEEYAPTNMRVNLPDPAGGRLVATNINELDPYYTPKIDEAYIHLDSISDPKCNTFPEMAELDDAPIFGMLPDLTMMLWDAKLKLEENTLEQPLSDGGGSINIATGEMARCMNAPQTFMNEDTCQLSSIETACTASEGAPLTDILLNEENIISLYTLTGRYVYAIKGLVIKEDGNDVVAHPCTVGTTSRWERAADTTCTSPTVLGSVTSTTLSNLILGKLEENPFITDILFSSGNVCDSQDTDVEIEIQVGPHCFTHVHPQHLDVYDVTYWTDPNTHPGNKRGGEITVPHPIKKWAESTDKTTYPGWFLIFPSTHPTDPTLDHPMNRWETRHVNFDYVGKFGSTVAFRDLPNDLRLDQVAQYFGAGTGGSGGGVLVCGSIGEVRNNPSLGTHFDMTAPEFDTSGDNWQRQQRATVWTMVALESADQLRQRMAWALSQVLVIVAAGIDADMITEAYVAYYDIFVRNAFGNYRDILSEISYSPLMAEHLSYLESKSAAYVYETSNRIAFADENFAREVMQLFTVGLNRLNQDGTQILDVTGKTIQVYDNEDIMSFARAWTGFRRQSSRGNIEDGRFGRRNRVDPMAIDSSWRDRFPKSDLLDGYIGDGYPLCVDLPERMFLRKGARYRLLGSSPLPKLMADNDNFAKDDLYNISRLVLNSATSSLYNILSNGGQYATTVVLGSNLACDGNECLVDTARVVKVDDVYYEYVRPPCVELSFYDGGKPVSRDTYGDDSRLCANPALPYASEACLNPSNLEEKASRNYLYEGERMTYQTAEVRCSEGDKVLGTFYAVEHNGESWRTGYHWQTGRCDIHAVIDSDGYVAITHNPFNYNTRTAVYVSEMNLNFFKVYWNGGTYPTVDNNCDNFACKPLPDGCLCATEVIESQVFTADPSGSNEILSALSFGAVDPGAFDAGTFGTPEVVADFSVYKRASSNAYSKDSVFQVTDSNGRVHLLKNSVSTVNLKGWSYQPTINEAEDAVIDGSQVVLSTSCCHTGSGYVDYQTSDAYVNWTVNVPDAGDYTIYFRYALSSSQSRPLEISVNGVVVTSSLDFPPTGHWSNYHHTEPLTLSLVAGDNLIRAQGTGSSGANIDHLRIERDVVVDLPYSFRNAPHFMSMIPDKSPNGIGETTIRDAQYETDAVLDHYFYHDNTAPFLCIRFIQRFGISNPSPRFVAACADAFRTGSYAYTISGNSYTFGEGKYGDLKATVACVVLDREATSIVLDKDPAFGSLREPIMKVISLMRSLEFTSKPQTPSAILYQMEGRIGQQAHQFDTVFSFFLPEYTPDLGPAGRASLVAPEAQLIDMPKTISLLNGMFGMIKYGLSDCNFGRWPGYGSCSYDGDYSRASGILDYQPAVENADFIVDELSLLLTSGRLSKEHRQYAKDVYNSFADKVKALKMVQQLIATSPEFHSTNTVALNGSSRPLPSEPQSSGSEYKALVYLFLSGACDSFNMLAPHTCAAVGGEPDLHEQYMTVRGNVALNKAETLEILANNAAQPCTSFGLHPMLSTLKQLYEDSDALFIANAGVLAKPVTIENARTETPVQLFAHNSMQRETKVVDIYNEIVGTGVVGRLVDSLSRGGVKTGSFSIDGNTITLKGAPGVSTPFATISSSGLTEFNPKPTSGTCRDMTEMIKAMNNATEPESGFFSETWSLAMDQALNQHADLFTALELSSVGVFPTTSLGRQLETVARLIQTRDVRGNDREVFYVSVGGYDTHSDVEIQLNNRFVELDGALAAFVAEMNSQGMWENVVLAQYSEFARTLVPNGGAGTDHAWGGNHFMVGGALNGGRVIGKYPSDLRRAMGYVLDDARGRLVPTTPFDASWNGMAQWFGVPPANLAEVIPNKDNFPASDLFDIGELFI